MDVKGKAYNANGKKEVSIAVTIHKPIAQEVGLRAGDSIHMYTLDKNKIVIEKSN